MIFEYPGISLPTKVQSPSFTEDLIDWSIVPSMVSNEPHTVSSSVELLQGLSVWILLGEVEGRSGFVSD